LLGKRTVELLGPALQVGDQPECLVAAAPVRLDEHCERERAEQTDSEHEPRCGPREAADQPVPRPERRQELLGSDRDTVGDDMRPARDSVRAGEQQRTRARLAAEVDREAQVARPDSACLRLCVGRRDLPVEDEIASGPGRHREADDAPPGEARPRDVPQRGARAGDGAELLPVGRAQLAEEQRSAPADAREERDTHGLDPDEREAGEEAGHDTICRCVLEGPRVAASVLGCGGARAHDRLHLLDNRLDHAERLTRPLAHERALRVVGIRARDEVHRRRRADAEEQDEHRSESDPMPSGRCRCPLRQIRPPHLCPARTAA
jgi:hypothetical protein